MKIKVLYFSAFLIFASCILLFSKNTQSSFILKAIPDVRIDKDKNAENRTEELKLRAHEEFLKTVDPALGYVPTDRLITGEIRAKQIMQSLYPSGVNVGGLVWTERGPNNIGGRTRTIVVDKTDATGNTVIAGSVGGGIWRTTTFLNANPVWAQIASVSQNLAITTIAQSPNSTLANDTLYAGTGEGYGNSDAIRTRPKW